MHNSTHNRNLERNDIIACILLNDPEGGTRENTGFPDYLSWKWDLLDTGYAGEVQTLPQKMSLSIPLVHTENILDLKMEVTKEGKLKTGKTDPRATVLEAAPVLGPGRLFLRTGPQDPERDCEN